MTAEPARVRLTGAQRREEIVAAAQSVFTASGLGGARTSQIAEAAGVAESMLYKHFASKRDLFDAAVTQPVARFVQSVIETAELDTVGLLDQDGPGGERFYRSFLETMTEVLPLLGVALFSDAEEGRRFYNASIVPLFDRYQDKIARSLAPDTRVDAGFLARAVIGIMFLLALDAGYREGATLDGTRRDALADEVRAFVAGGLAGSLRREHEAEARRERDAERTGLAAESSRLAEENATLRRVVADQAIELRRLRDQVGDQLRDELPGGRA